MICDFLYSSVSEVQAHDTALLKQLAKTFNLTYNAFGSQISEGGASASGTLTLSAAFQDGLEPAPITPTGADAAPYQLLSGTIKATYNTHRSINDTDPVIVAPSIMSGNTDTRFYWRLSPHIFRYNHYNAAGKRPLSGIHTVNECTLMFCVYIIDFLIQSCSPDIFDISHQCGFLYGNDQVLQHAYSQCR